MHYHKLVRDNIPNIIAAKGETAVTHIAGDDEYWQKLLEKLHEEVEEFCRDGNPEELADILEVLYAIATVKDTSPEQLEKLRSKKAAERGGFKKKIILESAES